MAIDNTTEKLTPAFKEKLHLFFEDIRKQGITNAYIFESYRTQARQNQLYAQGRTTTGNIVTWTKHSKHQDGKAVDIVFDASKTPGVGKRVPSWKGPYNILIKTAKKYGIKNLSPTETAHFQID